MKFGRVEVINTEREPIPASLRRQVLSRDRHTCRYCGASGVRKIFGFSLGNVELELDHVYPVSKGGDNSPGNLVAACRPCNRSKGNRVGMWPKPPGYFETKPRQNIPGWLVAAAFAVLLVFIPQEFVSAAFGLAGVPHAGFWEVFARWLLAGGVASGSFLTGFAVGWMSRKR